MKRALVLLVVFALGVGAGIVVAPGDGEDTTPDPVAGAAPTTFVSDECRDDVRALLGYVGDTHVNLSYRQRDDLNADICVRLANETAQVGGRYSIVGEADLPDASEALVADEDIAVCAATATEPVGATVRSPVVLHGVPGVQVDEVTMLVDHAVQEDAVSVCVQLESGMQPPLHSRLTLSAPVEAEDVATTVTELPFELDQPAHRVEPEREIPERAPSSTCQQAEGADRILNLQIADTHWWLYTFQESDEVSYVCVRAEQDGELVGGGLARAQLRAEPQIGEPVFTISPPAVCEDELVSADVGIGASEITHSVSIDEERLLHCIDAGSVEFSLAANVDVVARLSWEADDGPEHGVSEPGLPDIGIGLPEGDIEGREPGPHDPGTDDGENGDPATLPGDDVATGPLGAGPASGSDGNDGDVPNEGELTQAGDARRDDAAGAGDDGGGAPVALYVGLAALAAIALGAGAYWWQRRGTT